MTATDQIMDRIGEAIGLGHQGERAAARQLFGHLWNDIGGQDGDPLHRCAIAHSMADVQDDVHDELRWDLRALEAAGPLTDERVTLAGIDGTAADFFPSLHLNLGECYRKLGQFAAAQEQVRRARAALPALGDGGYSSMIRQGLDRLEAQLQLGAPR